MENGFSQIANINFMKCGWLILKGPRYLNGFFFLSTLCRYSIDEILVFFVWFAFPLFLFWGCDSISITPPIFGWIENIQIERLTHFGAGCDMSTNCFVDAIGSIKITHALLYNRKKKEYLFIWRCNRSTSVLRTHWFIHSLWLYVWWMNKRFQCYIARWNRIFECDVCVEHFRWLNSHIDC